MTDVTVPRAELEALQATLDSAETKQAIIETGLGELQASTAALHTAPLNQLPLAIDALVATERQIETGATAVGDDLTAASEMVSAMLSGEQPPDDPDLMLDLSDVDGIRKLGDGALKDARCLAMVLLAKSGDYRKAVGSKSTKNKSKTNGGGLGVGLWANGTLEGWVGSSDAGAIAQITNGAVPSGKRRFVAFNIADATLDLQLGSVERSIPRPATILPADGVTFLGAGAWGEQAPKDPLGGQLVRFRAWRGPKTKAERDAVMAEWTGVIDSDDVVVPPPNGGNGPTPPDGDVIKVSPGVTSSYLSGIAPGVTVQFAAGTYHGLHVTPKDRTTWRGANGDRSAVILEGDGATTGSAGPAFGGHAADVTIQWMTVQHYWGGGPRNLNAGAAGNSPTSWTNGGAGGIRPASGYGEGQSGLRWIIEDCEIKENYASGINVSNYSIVRRCSIHDNGAPGIDGFADQVTAEDCDIYSNSRWHFPIHIHAGGVKSQAGFSGHPAFKNHVYRRLLVHDNWGDGLWWDWGMHSYLIEHCSIWGNTAHQVRFEASAGHTLRYCQLGAGSSDATGHMDGECVFIQNAGDNTIENNLIVATRSITMKLFQDNRGTIGENSSQWTGWFDSAGTTIKGNVFLMLNPSGKFTVDGIYAAPTSWNTSQDPNCTYKSSVLNKASDAYPKPNAFCFYPSTLAQMGLIVDGNTYRFPAAGQAPNRVNWPAETNAKILSPGNPEQYLPDWHVLPSWGDGNPPGL